MNENLTEIVCVLDRSGSMETIQQDAIGGFNQFLTEQQEQEGDARMTVVLFNHGYRILHDGADIQGVEPLSSETYRPGGTTALLDAVGRTIDDVGERLAETPEEGRPSKVIFVILTDGMENASQEYDYNRVKEMVGHQSDVYNWEFIFLGANIDAVAVAGSLNIKASHAVNYSADSLGTSEAFGKVRYAVSTYRHSGAVAADWKDADESGTTSYNE